jgi:hypothetical protein
VVILVQYYISSEKLTAIPKSKFHPNALTIIATKIKSEGLSASKIIESPSYATWRVLRLRVEKIRIY